ncbi:unnamed protein product [Acanthoscelides obtectus]|uniref:Uncharacterized protein n=1 Tax=Acanthoscelides obtectus TaxID=200917 RepID=A0A9P0LL57_ACAOB|nr:unnamed protein product [Acanthoscelides obtectus]CAK1627079.1 hypothetical protein AOBTE_LOCUS4285 [Acanthoscelides obtectus]
MYLSSNIARIISFLFQSSDLDNFPTISIHVFRQKKAPIISPTDQTMISVTEKYFPNK